MIKIELTKEEKEMNYNQLSARHQEFERMMTEAARKGNTDRVLQLAEGIKLIKSIMTKLLGVME